MLLGYDLSTAQGTITAQHWAIMAANGCKFVIVECGLGNDKPNLDYYNACMTGARAVGIIAVPYHFLYILPNSTTHANRDPESQAALHYSYCQSNACIDVEYPTSDKWAQFGIPSGAAGAAFINNWVMRYLAKYAELCGGTPWVYTYPSFANQMKFDQSIADYPLWIASYESTPTIPAPWTSWVCWQRNGGTDGTKLPSGAPVDSDVVVSIDVFNSLLGSSSAVVPVSDPVPDVGTNVAWATPAPPDPPISDPVSAASVAVANTNFWQSVASFFGWLFGGKSA